MLDSKISPDPFRSSFSQTCFTEGYDLCTPIANPSKEAKNSGRPISTSLSIRPIWSSYQTPCLDWISTAGCRNRLNLGIFWSWFAKSAQSEWWQIMDCLAVLLLQEMAKVSCSMCLSSSNGYICAKHSNWEDKRVLRKDAPYLRGSLT